VDVSTISLDQPIAVRRRSRPPRRAILAIFALLLGLGAGIGGLLGGFGYRWGWWSLGVGFAVVRWAAYVAAAGGALGLVALVLPPWRNALVWRCVAAAALFVGIAIPGVPYLAQRASDAAPRINDVTTDPENPPAFVAILPLRVGSPNPPGYGGPETARRQREGFPDIAPAQLDLPPADAFARVEVVADAMGWTVVAAVPSEGRLEAVAETPWFGLEDDIVVRIVADGAGSRVDIRSKSRIGDFDRGMNGRRVREFLQRLSQ
jgi:uncharacterized protein (DUF1499 family)